MRLSSLAVGLAIFCSAAQAQESVPAQSLNLDSVRVESLERLGVAIPDPSVIIADSELEFAKPLEKMRADILRSIADRANVYSNLVSMLSDEYNSYYRENYQYDFVQKAVSFAPATEEYGRLDSQFKGIRNRSYILLGRIAQMKGARMEALLYFNDAYRLSVFECVEGTKNCVRYEAEQYMKELLGISANSYVYWK
jgi:hypothetical protein